MKKLFFLFVLPFVVSAQNFHTTWSLNSVGGTPGGSGNVTITGAVTASLGGTTLTLHVPYQWGSFDAAGGTNYYVLNAGRITVNSVTYGPNTVVWSATSGVQTLTYTNSTMATYLAANDAAIPLLIGQVNTDWQHSSASVGGTVVGTGSFSFQWNHVAGNATPITAPGVVQKELTFAYTNSTGAPVFVGVGQYNSSTISAGTFTGHLQGGLWLGVSQTWTWNIVVSPSDTFTYAITLGDPTKQAGVTAQFQGVGSNSVTDYSNVTFLASSGTGGTYASGSGLTSAPSVTFSPSGQGSDGSELSGATIEYGTGQGPVGGVVGTVAAGSVTAPSPVTPTAPTTGPGTGGASDAGLTDAATAIDNTAATVGSTLATAGATNTNALMGQDAKDTQAIVSALANGTPEDSNVKTLAQDQVTALAANPTLAAMQAAGNSQATSDASLIPGTSIPGTPSVTTVAPSLGFTFPAIFGGASIDCNPFESGRLAGVCSAFRSAIQWLLLAYLAYAVSQIIREEVHAFSAARQAQGNAVVGGTGGQATAFIAAGAISVLVTLALGAVVGLVADYGFGSLLSYWGTNALGSFGAGVLWMLDQVFPLADLMLYMMLKPFFNFLATKGFVLAATAIRFIVP